MPESSQIPDRFDVDRVLYLGVFGIISFFVVAELAVMNGPVISGMIHRKRY